jgi:hypothetical protein
VAPSLACYVSGHGWGHAVRSAALLAALRRRAADGLEIHVRSEAPSRLFTDRDPLARCVPAAVDVGVLQRDALELDLAGTLAAHERFLGQWEAASAREAAWLRGIGAALVIADVPPLAFAAAWLARVPALAVANFSWDWILEAYVADEPRFAPAVARYAEAYGHAETLFRLPLHGALPAFRGVRDVPHLVNRARRPRAQVQAALGLDPRDPRPLVLVSFGGFGSVPLAPRDWDDLAGYRFLAPAPAPAGFPAPWQVLPSPSPVPHEEVVAACDAVLGKAGYSTCAEVLAHGRRLLFLRRAGFREAPILEAAMLEQACARALPREDFLAGRWRAHLDALCAASAAPPVRADGAEVLAEAVLGRL